MFLSCDSLVLCPRRDYAVALAVNHVADDEPVALEGIEHFCKVDRVVGEHAKAKPAGLPREPTGDVRLAKQADEREAERKTAGLLSIEEIVMLE